MSNFSEALTSALNDTTQGEFAARMSIDRTEISRYCSGAKTITRERLLRILRAIDNKTKRLHLLLAYLKDEALVGIQADIHPGDYAIAPKKPANDNIPPLDLTADIDTIVARCLAPNGQPVRDLLRALAEFIHKENLSAAHAKAKPQPPRR
ncbi:helix-turn-helix domain-containing protein [Termitidicoccus mucosus]|uniref:HTH cro/C1-type domain-containing protein n=1 Tax=Termitidicoccus mucosus TaxID=1184151 RepID=A0A178IBP3_9BACT|nr:hypothetical protein AW736_25065 [Opitutaceae bacterium TSB47]